MTRSYDSDVLLDSAGNVIVAALGTLYTDAAATTLVTDNYTAETGGSLSNTVTTDGSGRWAVHFTAQKSYWVRWSDNSNTAYAANNPTVPLTWATFTSPEHQAFEKAGDEAADDAAFAAHLADTVDAHDASAVSVVPFAAIAATDVQAALAEVDAEAAHLSTANTFTGVNRLLAVKELEGVLFADQFAGASVTAKLDAAITDLAGGPGVVAIPASMGSGEPTTVPENVTLLDLGRGTLGKGFRLNASSVPLGGAVDTSVAVAATYDNPTVGVSIEMLQANLTLTGDIPASQSFGSITTTTLVNGALGTVGAGCTIIGGEFTAKVGSTGGTLPRVRGVTASVSLIAGSTTNVTDAAALVAQALIDGGSGAIANSYGLVAEAQTVGSTLNYGIYNQGDTLIDNNRAIDAKTTGGVVKHIERYTTGDGVLYGTLNDTVGWTWRDQAATTTYMTLTSAKLLMGADMDIEVPSTALLKGLGGVQGKYMSGAGIVTIADADFGNAPGDGAIAIVNNTTDGKVYLVARCGGGFYKKVELI